MKQFLSCLSILLLSVVSCHSQNKEEMKAKATELIGNLYKDVHLENPTKNAPFAPIEIGHGFLQKVTP